MSELKWIVACKICAGNGSVENEDGLLWTCPTCDGTGEDRSKAEWGGTIVGLPAV